MGQYVSKIKGHYVTRNLQRFNIESRTDKILDAEKPKAAPKYASDEKVRQDLLRDMQKQMDEEIKDKSSQHDSRLKQVYVQSHDPLPDTGFDPDINRRRPLNPDRPLPQKRTIRGIDRSGFAVDESKIIKKGKISLEKVQEMAATHKLDPEKNTPTILAQYYGLDLAHTEAVLEHFRIFGHRRIKAISAKEKQDREDPYRAQPDWVEEAGEHPPVITDDQIPKAGVLPKFAVDAIAGSNAPKPFTLKKESTKTISPGSQEQSEKLTGAKEKLKLSKPSKDNE